MTWLIYPHTANAIEIAAIISSRTFYIRISQFLDWYAKPMAQGRTV
jgi:hypothetical protein